MVISNSGNYLKLASHSNYRFLCFLVVGFLGCLQLCADDKPISNASPTSKSARLDRDSILPDTQAFSLDGDISARMVQGIDRFLDRQLEESMVVRETFWHRNYASPQAYSQSIETNRDQFRKYLGAIDSRSSIADLEVIDKASAHGLIETPLYTVREVRWPVFDGVHGEGLLLEPNGAAIANIIALPDASQSPESISGLTSTPTSEHAFAKKLAENGCRVLVPVLLNRESQFSGSSTLNRWIQLSHREWIWRMAFEVGRTPIGYEVQKVLSAVDYFSIATRDTNSTSAPQLPIGVAGYGEGGRIALYAAALDSRIQSTWVSGYFDSRQKTWTEPADRMVWSLLKEFGDAEVASLIAPRSLIIEFNDGPVVDKTILPKPGQRPLAAPGKLAVADFHSVDAEVVCAKHLAGPFASYLQFVYGDSVKQIGPGSNHSILHFLKSLGFPENELKVGEALVEHPPVSIDTHERQRRTVKELENFTQKLVNECERKRADLFWNTIKASSPESWQELQQRYRHDFDSSVIGKWDTNRAPLNPQSRLALNENGELLVEQDSTFTAWDIKLDVFPDVFAWGVLLLPKDLQPNQRRPVVVCQHGLEGLPEHCITIDQSTRAWSVYKGFATQLAKRGFIVFVPHNPYRGGDAFRQLQRKSWLLGRHLFSTIHAQHACVLDWLELQPFVDGKRIAFYGLSYGGKSAMRIPAVDERYCLSICSGDFNEWVRKNASTDYPSSYLYTPEYEIFEWNLGHTYNYAEMAALIAPRPFMVEHGFQDRVATAEWASYEYAKVRRFYAQLGIVDKTQYEFFDGPHTINGKGTFEFLHRHLNWPNPLNK